MTASELTPITSTPGGALVPADLSRVGAYVDASLSANTRRAYASGFADFRAWCESRNLAALPTAPETLAAYLADLADAGRSPSTIGQRAAAIRFAHEQGGHEAPNGHKGVRATLAGIRRELGTAPKARKLPATVERIAAMLAHADASSLKGLRDRALMLVGFASAMRRSELVALDLADLELTAQGLLVTVRRSKGDQEARGVRVAIPFGRSELCPVLALGAWLEAASESVNQHRESTEGPVFRSVTRHGALGSRLSASAVAGVVKEHAKRAGLDPKAFAGHSLRAGFATSAAERGARLEQIAEHTRHRSLEVARGYVRRASAFTDHAGDGLL